MRRAAARRDLAGRFDAGLSRAACPASPLRRFGKRIPAIRNLLYRVQFENRRFPWRCIFTAKVAKVARRPQRHLTSDAGPSLKSRDKILLCVLCETFASFAVKSSGASLLLENNDSQTGRSLAELPAFTITVGRFLCPPLVEPGAASIPGVPEPPSAAARFEAGIKIFQKAPSMRAPVSFVAACLILCACSNMPNEPAATGPTVTVPMIAGAEARVAPSKAIEFCQRFGKNPYLLRVEPGKSSGTDLATYECVTGPPGP
jgi:hypothetical protein